MSAFKKVIGWFRGAPTEADDPETAAEAERLREDRQTVRSSQAYIGQMGPGMASVTPTPDVLHPGDEER